jgi:hypothetical protein
VDVLGASDAVLVSRRDPGAYDPLTGLWTRGVASEFTVDAHVQPATRRDVDLLPEGERAREAIAVYTPAELRTSEVALGLEADTLAWSGRTWEVRRLEDWSAQAGYYRAVAVRLAE